MSNVPVSFPTAADVPTNPYRVVYDAEYTGFKPFTGDHGYERTGQTVSVFSPELQSDRFFAIRELRTYKVDYDGNGLRKSVIDVLSKDSFAKLVESGFDIEFNGGVPIGTSDVYSGVSHNSLGTVSGQWPSPVNGYTEAILAAFCDTGKFDIDTSTVFDARDRYESAMRMVDLNPGPMRGALITPGDVRADLMQESPWVVGVNDFYSKLKLDQDAACHERAVEHEQVRREHPSTLLDRLSWAPTTRAVDVVPWTETLASVGAVKSATPMDMYSDFDSNDSVKASSAELDSFGE